MIPPWQSFWIPELVLVPTICPTFLIASTVPTKPGRASSEALGWDSPSHAGLRKRIEVPSKFKALWALGPSFVSVFLFFGARLLHTYRGLSGCSGMLDSCARVEQ